MPWEKVAFSREVLWAINAATDLERTSFKVQPTGGICPHHEVGVHFSRNPAARALGSGAAGMVVGGQAGRAAAAGTTHSTSLGRG